MNQSGWHFLQIPGPTNVPDRVLRAMARPTIDHRGPEFAALTLELIAGLQRVFKTKEPVVIYPGSGSGASEAAYVNTLSPGDRIIVFETGHLRSSGSRSPSASVFAWITCRATGAAGRRTRSSNRG
jgi:alanine-glyoxylate transaminase/serine-glyoxylate transaminase/serine-pyruvate transaminase